jgi:hypothetical protein
LNGDPPRQLRDRGLAVVHHRGLDAGQAGDAQLGPVAGDLNLLGERMHVLEQPVRQIALGIGPGPGGVGGGLVEQAVEGGQAAGEDGDRQVVEFGGHGGLSGLVGFY